MRFLLDTHSLIWFFKGDKELSSKAKQTIEDSFNSECFVSIASIWEMAIKIKLGKLEFKNFETIENALLENNFNLLPITIQSAIAISQLTLNHRDPFDRIIIAQA